jgi:hypothetical protein
MDRRSFFKNLITGASGIVIAPHLLSQIVEQDYPQRPEQLFEKAGFWAFQNDKLVMWSELEGVELEMKREMIDITRDPRFHDITDMGYREYIPGKSSYKWSIERVVIEHSFSFLDPFEIIVVNKQRTEQYHGKAMLTAYSTDPFADGKIMQNIQFHLNGILEIRS